MNTNKKDYRKWGIAFAIFWNVFVLGFYTLVCLYEGVSFTQHLEMDTWLGFGACYVMATAVWYYMGYAIRKEYLTKRERYFATYKGLQKDKIDVLYRLFFFKKYAKTLAIVFAVAIPWYMLANVRGHLSHRNLVYISIFLIISLSLACIYNYLKRKIETYH